MRRDPKMCNVIQFHLSLTRLTLIKYCTTNSFAVELQMLKMSEQKKQACKSRIAHLTRQISSGLPLDGAHSYEQPKSLALECFQ